MAEITNDQTHEAYRIAKEVFNNEISKFNGVNYLTSIGMNENSAKNFIANYTDMMNGKSYHWTMSEYQTNYFLEKIFEEHFDFLQKVLDAVAGHIEYYKGKTGNEQKPIRKIYEKYLAYIKK